MFTKLVHYQRNLPRWLPPGETFFSTFRLAGSLLLEVTEQFRTTVETAKETEAEEEHYAR